MDMEHHVTGVEADNGIRMGGTVVEEVIDDRPRTISYKKDCAAENGD